MTRYIKCPRCELNYIEEGKELCEICLAQTQGRHLRYADIDDFDGDDIEKTKICPVCGENYIYPSEKICEECKDKNILQEEDEIDVEVEQDDEWRKYLDEDIRELSIDEEEEIDEELDESLDEEFEEDVLDDFEECYITEDDDAYDEDDDLEEDEGLGDDDF